MNETNDYTLTNNCKTNNEFKPNLTKCSLIVDLVLLKCFLELHTKCNTFSFNHGTMQRMFI